MRDLISGVRSTNNSQSRMNHYQDEFYDEAFNSPPMNGHTPTITKNKFTAQSVISLAKNETSRNSPMNYDENNNMNGNYVSSNLNKSAANAHN